MTAAAGGTAISVRSLSHWFGSSRAKDDQVLDVATLDIAPHKFVSLLGPSGCGKTTLLRMLHGLILPAEGSIAINGERVTRPTANRAMVFQEHNLLPWKTVIDNVEFACDLVGMSRADRRTQAQSTLEQVGLSKFGAYYPHELSGGMKQRVGIARALAIKPDMLLMDEPFGALDAQTREIMQIELLRLWETDRKTVVFVTHSIDESILLSDEIIVMTHRPGRVKRIVPIELPRPRQAVARDGAEWGRLRRLLWELLSPEIEHAA